MQKKKYQPSVPDFSPEMDSLALNGLQDANSFTCYLPGETGN